MSPRCRLQLDYNPIDTIDHLKFCHEDLLKALRSELCHAPECSERVEKICACCEDLFCGRFVGLSQYLDSRHAEQHLVVRHHAIYLDKETKVYTCADCEEAKVCPSPFLNLGLQTSTLSIDICCTYSPNFRMQQLQ